MFNFVLTTMFTLLSTTFRCHADNNV